MLRNGFVLVFLLAGTALATAQHGQHGRHEQPAKPYAGHQARMVKALSENEIADLKAGRGMGLALPAELNGYPGPIHVLEHAEALGLSVEQRTGMERLYEIMRAEAVTLGERVIVQETALDRAFSERRVTPESLALATAEIGATRAALRTAHLRTHLETVKILSEEQIRRYEALRGYR